MPDRPVRGAYLAYLYAVCLVAVLTLTFGSAAALFGAVRAGIPEQTVMEDQAFGAGVEVQPDDVDRERRRGLAGVISNSVLVVVAAGILVVHWRGARRIRNELEDAAPAGGTPGSG